MQASPPKKARSISGFIGKAFVLASVAAVILPMPRYARSLDQAEYVVWLVRVAWVLALTVGVCGLLLLAGIVARKIQDRKSTPPS